MQEMTTCMVGQVMVEGGVGLDPFGGQGNDNRKDSDDNLYGETGKIC